MGMPQAPDDRVSPYDRAGKDDARVLEVGGLWGREDDPNFGVISGSIEGLRAAHDRARVAYSRQINSIRAGRTSTAGEAHVMTADQLAGRTAPRTRCDVCGVTAPAFIKQPSEAMWCMSCAGAEGLISIAEDEDNLPILTKGPKQRTSALARAIDWEPTPLAMPVMGVRPPRPPDDFKRASDPDDSRIHEPRLGSL
jgi:hypothetical protein